ncbi:unnamed protein product, partial [Rotaria sp. Silwood1]
RINLLQDQIEPIDIDYTLVINDDEPTEQLQQQEPEQVEDEPLQVVDEPEQVQRRPKHQRSAQSRN